MAQIVLDALTKKFGDAIERTESQHGDEIAYVKRDRLLEVATWLRDDASMAFDQAMQCVQGRRLKIGIGNDPINNHRTMIQKHLDQVVAGAAKPV